MLELDDADATNSAPVDDRDTATTDSEVRDGEPPEADGEASLPDAQEPLDSSADAQLSDAELPPGAAKLRRKAGTRCTRTKWKSKRFASNTRPASKSAAQIRRACGSACTTPIVVTATNQRSALKGVWQSWTQRHLAKRARCPKRRAVSSTVTWRACVSSHSPRRRFARPASARRVA